MQPSDDELIQRRQDFHDRHYRNGLGNNKQEAPERLWWHFRMKIRNITSRYIVAPNPMGVFEVDLHEAWEEFIEAAKVTPVDDPAAERLVLQIVIARRLGQLSRLDSGGEGGVQNAVTGTGERMWCDLPFFAADLRKFWITSAAAMDRDERANLAGVSGRLSASGVCDPEITECVLILLREALETPRALISGDDGEEESLSDFLPAVQAWVSQGSYEILKLCMQEHFPSKARPGFGDWYVSGTLIGERISGFSMLRWTFWIQRLEDVGNKTSDETVREQCRRSANIMKRWEIMTGGHGDEGERARAHRAHFLKHV